MLTAGVKRLRLKPINNAFAVLQQGPAYHLAGGDGAAEGGRERTMGLPGSAVDALKGHRLRGPYVFSQEHG
ncbi:hypothetical protein ATI61_103521 [Archangium gephyra]|uniref:Uncharacterized protein n=1 Tax=Archangium gephyra TaxID=48 RepID=A0ABX9K754_9BACT|nr:hypothetical protein ATI61_103521 [Archangium gephyra]